MSAERVMMNRTTQRVETAGTIVTVTTTVEERSKFVDYDDIRAAVAVEPDEGFEAPWDESDGWEHQFDRVDWDSPDERRGCVGYVVGQRRYESGVITIDDDLSDEYEFARRNGQSKQVAAERVAMVRRERTEQLVRWYEHGWSVWFVAGEYEGYTGDGPLGGIYDDDGDYAEECADELADSIAAEMEDDGYVVMDRPDRPKRTSAQNRHDHNKWRSRVIVTTGRDLINRRYRRHIQEKRDRAVARAQSA